MNPLTRAAARPAPTIDPDLAGVVRAVRAFAVEHIDAARIDREGRLDDALLAALGDQGWFGLTVPREHGGAALSLGSATRVVTELASYDGSVGTCVGLHSGLALHALLHVAREELRQRVLPEIAAGRCIAAFAATEPGAGSDIASVRTTLRADGGALRLSGSKCFVTNGGLASIVTVLARSPGLGGARAGHTLVAIDPRWPGVHRGREEHKLGLRGSSTITIDFDDVVVPGEHVLGEPSRGLDYAHRALGWGRTFMAAGCLGAARSAWHAARAHVATRAQFGRPLIEFPLVRETIATMRAELRAIERVLEIVCDDDELAIPSAIVKILASEGAHSVIDRALQLLGGSGYMEDSGMPRRLRDVRVTRIFEGANDVLRLHLASDALGWSAFELPRDADDELSGALRSFADAVDAVKRALGFRLFAQQALQTHIADAIVALYTAIALSPVRDDLDRLARHLQLERARAATARILAPRIDGYDQWIASAAD